MCGLVLNRGVIIPALESIPESDFPPFSEIDDSNSNSNSSKNWFLLCTGIDSGYWNRFQNGIFIMAVIPILIPEKNGIITPLVWNKREAWLDDLGDRELEGRLLLRMWCWDGMMVECHAPPPLCDISSRNLVQSTLRLLRHFYCPPPIPRKEGLRGKGAEPPFLRALSGHSPNLGSVKRPPKLNVSQTLEGGLLTDWLWYRPYRLQWVSGNRKNVAVSDCHSIRWFSVQEGPF